MIFYLKDLYGINVKHECPDWDYLEIDETDPEFECCTCNLKENMTYFKIQNLYKKTEPDADKRRKLIIGDYSCQEFTNIKQWRVDEKVDGTNIRIMYSNGIVQFGGKTDAANIPAHLVGYLMKTFTGEVMQAAFPPNDDGTWPSVVIYGEGYGSKIQEPQGSNYRKDVAFICFDIQVGNWWLERGHVRALCQQLGIQCVPELGVMNLPMIEEFVRNKPLSIISEIPQMMEGVVCRSDPLVLFRNQKPVIFKLRCKDLIP